MLPFQTEGKNNSLLAKLCSQIRPLNNIYYRLQIFNCPCSCQKSLKNYFSRKFWHSFNPNLTPRFSENFTIALKALETQQIGSINKSADQQCPFQEGLEQ
ncbi:hypothetical protein CDAR_541761 [Caerostris darwini]|uniref:Uncharacterized protein n=1 Tax=Caerostris darwini TaxID=1538125 RepID=A0AAV4UUJ2_9ARAC|nr:hypothetical protein CDAR_541761 [Caerostris darwini]